MSSTNTECPICMDTFVGHLNKVVTECGHAFHCSCLMQNVAHNGFGCPYCREKMADEVEEEDTIVSWDDEEVTVFDEDALTSFRMFHQRLNGEEVEEEEEEEENDWSTVSDEEEEEEEAAVEEEHYEILPSSQYVADKLAENGITYEDLVKSLLESEHDYPDFRRRSAEVYGQFRIVLTQYSRQNEELRLRVNRLREAIRAAPRIIIETPTEDVKQVIVELPAIAEEKPARVDLD
jgi:hypothetical protein